MGLGPVPCAEASKHDDLVCLPEITRLDYFIVSRVKGITYTADFPFDWVVRASRMSRIF